MTAARFIALFALAACSEPFESLQPEAVDIEVCADAATDHDTELAFEAGQTLETLAHEAPEMEPRAVDIAMARAIRSLDEMDAGRDMGLLVEEIRLDFVDGTLDRTGLSHEVGLVLRALPGELRVEGRPELIHAFECGRWVVHEAVPYVQDS